MNLEWIYSYSDSAEIILDAESNPIFNYNFLINSHSMH